MADEGRRVASVTGGGRGVGRASALRLARDGRDAEMLATAAVGIAVLGPEGLAVRALASADLVVGSIEDALDLLLRPRRLVATLRR